MNKQQAGPATFDDMAALLAKGRGAGGIGGETHVWCPAMVEWRRLKDLPLLSKLQSMPTPESLSPRSSNVGGDSHVKAAIPSGEAPSRVPQTVAAGRTAPKPAGPLRLAHRLPSV